MARTARFPVSDHCDGRRFFNPPHFQSTDKTPRDLLRFWAHRGWAPWPERVDDPPQPPPAPPVPGALAVTHVGHATFLVRTAGLSLLTDPVFSEHAGPFGRLGPKRARAPGVRLAQLPDPNLVLVSHGHFDHLDRPSLAALARRFAPRAVVGLGNGPLLNGDGFAHVEELDWWTGTRGPGGCRVTFVPAQHWSARAPFRRNTTLWGGFVVETDAGTLYFAGDTGYGPHFKEIGARFPRIDVALLPIGAYEPRWFMAPQHMNPEEAVAAHEDLGARTSVAMHFGTFRLTPEAIDAPVRALADALARRGIAPERFIVPAFGETHVFNAPA
ncbi:MAG TPA: MBL fold metallo-hydrolase [Azospirillum sp.]